MDFVFGMMDLSLKMMDFVVKLCALAVAMPPTGHAGLRPRRVLARGRNFGSILGLFWAEKGHIAWIDTLVDVNPRDEDPDDFGATRGSAALALNPISVSIEVRFLLKNLHFLLKNLHFLLKNLHFYT